MLFNSEHSESIRIVVKAVRPSDGAKFIINIQFAERFGIAENDTEIVGTIIVKINARDSHP